MKKILVWETSAIIGGGQKMTLIVTDMLKHTSEGYDFIYLIPGKGPLTDELDKQNIPYHIMGDQTLPAGVKSRRMIFRYAWLSLKGIVGFLKVAAREKPDIIYIPGPAALPWGAICATLIRKPVIWHLHHIFLDGATKKMLNLFGGWQSVKTIIAVSDSVANQIISKKTFDKKKTIYNPVDVEKYASGCGETIIEELAVKKKQNTIILGQIALLQPSKRQDFLIAMVEKLKAIGYDAHALFVGRARNEDATYELQLRKIVERKGLNDCVQFMGQRSDVPDILQAIDVLVVPSLEGFPLVALEAMAAAKPVVTISTGGSAELITISRAGYCFNEDNLLQAVETVIMAVNSTQRKVLKRNGAAFVRKCSYENYSNRVRKVFGEVYK